ncbi:hypothetical protein [Caballeronia sp. KNU42]
MNKQRLCEDQLDLERTRLEVALDLDADIRRIAVKFGVGGREQIGYGDERWRKVADIHPVLVERRAIVDDVELFVVAH